METITSANDLANVLQGYRLCAQAEGKSRKTILVVVESASYLERFLHSEGLTTDVTAITPNEIRAFVLYLQRKRRFSGHPLAKAQDDGLSPTTINSYLRAIRAFWSWLLREEIIIENPFSRVKIPRAPRKVVNTFSESQLQSILNTIDTSRTSGFRDYVIMLTLLDTGLRVSELTGLRLDDLRLEEGLLKVVGKGGKERLIPIGRGVKQLLWRYITSFRPEPTKVNCQYVFLTHDGRPLTGKRIGYRIAAYGRRAELSGVRCSPHTLRHTAAVSFLRNGGDVFSLQRLLGHSTLAMTRHYCELADVDVKRAHSKASPVDNLGLKTKAKRAGRRM